MVKAAIALLLFLVSPFLFAQQSSQTFSRSSYYAAMAANKLELLTSQEGLIKQGDFPKKEAFEGALLMRKAGLLTKTQEKLSVFKAGHKKLESAISKEQTNPEYRFLRLMIQENAPKVVKYRDNIKGDGEFIKANYRQMPVETQKALVDYSKVSKVLTPSDF